MDDLEYLQPDFDPSSRSVKVSDLHRIFIDHGVRYAQAKNKADLVSLYEQHIRPKAAKLLAKYERVRASSTGIEDRRLPATDGQPPKSSNAKPRKPLIPPQQLSTFPSSASSSRLSAVGASDATGQRASGSRKSASMNNLAAEASSGVTAKQSVRRDGVVRRSSVEPATSRRSSSRRSASIEPSQDPYNEDEDMLLVEEDVPQSSKKRSSGATGSRRQILQFPSSRAQPHAAIDETDDEVDELMDVDAVENEPSPVIISQVAPQVQGALPVRRTVVEIEVPLRRKSEIISPQKRKKRESDGTDEGKSGFSDFNPFQSSPEAEDAKKRRRKSSLGVQREASVELAGIRRSKTLADFASTSTSASADPLEHKRASLSAPKPSPGLERFKSRLSGSPDALPVPLRETKSTPRSSNTLPAGLSSLAQAPETFQMKSYASPRTQPSTSSKDQRDEAKRVYRALEQQVQEEAPLYQSEAISESDDEPSMQVAATASSPADTSPPRKTSPARKGPNPSAADNLSDGANRALTKSGAQSKRIAKRTAQGTSLASAMILLAALWQSASVWADGKKALGFCNTGAGVNDAVIQRQSQSMTVHQKEFDPSSWQDYSDRACDMLAPMTCVSCPEQATCENGQVISCNRDYILLPNPIAYLVSSPGTSAKSILPLLLPPRCAPDTAHLQRVFETAARAGSHLRQLKGDVICSNQVAKRSREAIKLVTDGPPDAWIYGMTKADLQSAVRQQHEVEGWEKFDRIFDEAIEYLSNHTEILQTEIDGHRWIAATAADMPLTCRARLAAYSRADQNKGSLGLLGLLLASATYGRMKIRRHRQISEEVDELVPLSLSLLQAQYQNYNMRDSMTPYPYLAPVQLRDLVLRDERSTSRKAELWARVEKRVESNANVRVRVAEQHGEDVRVWQWIGAAYEVESSAADSSDTNGAKSRRRSYAAITPRSSLARAGLPNAHASDRHVSWDEEASGLLASQDEAPA